MKGLKFSNNTIGVACGTFMVVMLLANAIAFTGGTRADAAATAAPSEVVATAGDAETDAEAANSEADAEENAEAADGESDADAANSEADAEAANGEENAEAETTEEAAAPSKSYQAVGAVEDEIPSDAVTATGSAKGINGDVTLQVTATPEKLYQIQVVEEAETEGIGSVAIATLPDEIYKAQSLQVDGVTGATVTSEAIKNAIRNALETAGVSAAAFEAAPVPTDASEEEQPAEDVTYDTDVVVIGAGGAGMIAAIVAADAGQNVIVVESMPMVGGNSIRSTGGMNAAKTVYQDKNAFDEAAGVEKQLEAAKGEEYADNAAIQELAATVAEQWEAYQASPSGYFDSVELFQLDTLIGGHGLNNPALVKKLTEESAGAIDWLHSVGADLTDVSSFGGASVKRIHRPVDASGKTVSVGEYIVPILQENLEKREQITLYLNTKATEILMSDGAAAGIVAEGADGGKITINAKAVVDAAGGFGANQDKVVSYRPDLEGFVSTNSAGAQGQGVDMAVAIGADTVDMEQIQIHPTVEFNTAALITEGLRGDGAILVNAEGYRFYDEVSTRDKVSAAEIEQTDSFAWLIMDAKMAENSNVIQGYIRKGYTVQGDTYEALAEAMGVPADTFRSTMELWNGFASQKSDPIFNRTSFAAPLDMAPFYAVKVTPGIHHTMGGLKINEDAEVIDTSGNVIPGLYAAGEVTGGVHGGNRLGGNAVADFVVFGCIAGTNAAAYAQG